MEEKWSTWVVPKKYLGRYLFLFFCILITLVVKTQSIIFILLGFIYTIIVIVHIIFGTIFFKKKHDHC